MKIEGIFLYQVDNFMFPRLGLNSRGKQDHFAVHQVIGDYIIAVQNMHVQEIVKT